MSLTAFGRCEITELLQSQCAHCRTPDVRPQPGDLPHGPPFDARYPGVCGNDSCSRFFHAGESIARLEDDPRIYICSVCGDF